MTIERRKDILAIIIGLIGGIKFRFIGTFYASEILIMLIAVSISWRPLFRNKYAANIFRLALLWLFSAFITDICVNNNLINSLKGEVSIIFLLIQFPVLFWLLCDKPKRFLYYLVAIGIVAIPNLYLFGPEYDENNAGPTGENIWLYYSMVPVAIALISWLYYKRKITGKTACLMMVAYGVFMLFHNSRNIFLTMALAAILLYQIDSKNNFPISANIAKYKQKIAPTLIMLFLGMLAVNSVYTYLASNKILGEYAYSKYLKQTEAENILEGGRGETFMGIALITRKPIIGYGSFAMDKNDKYHREYAKEKGTKYIRPIFGERRLPAHSHLIGAWMENGIGGGIFWLYVLFLMWQVFRSGAMLKEPSLLPAILMTFTAEVWRIMFSPFGLRVPEAFFIMYLSIIYANIKSHSPRIL